jgi:excisionase family DNA binding protein
MMTGEKLLTVQQAAEQLGLREATVRKLIFQRRIDTVRPSVRAVRVPESAIKKILEQGYRPAIQVEARQR